MQTKTILIAILAVLSVALTGVLVWQNWGKVEPIMNNQPPITDETANWKTYTNEKYGFEMKYPNDWQSGLASWNSAKNIIEFTNDINYFGQDSTKIDREKSATISMLAPQGYNDVQLYFDEISKPCTDCAPGSPMFKSSLVVDGLKAIKAESTVPGSAGVISAFLVKNGMLFTISLQLPDIDRINSLNTEYESIFDQMLATFKFTK